MKLGVIIRVIKGGDIAAKIKQLHDLGFESCQLNCWDHSILDDELVKTIKQACLEYDVKISTVWVGWSGPCVWDFYDGPITIGLVPPEYRHSRIEELIHGSDFAKKLGVNQIATHFGYLPESPADPQYMPILSAIKHLARHCKGNGQDLLFETGQETPVTLLRYIEESGADNLGINLDPANLILYGKANPVDAVGIFGKYVRDVHAKDGNYPTDSKKLGKETPLGDGSVNFPLLITKLKSVGYDGPLTIEREIEGDEQTRDIIKAKVMLEELI